MNIVLVGKTGSGKSSICDYLTQNFRYEKFVSCTTRPKRSYEVDGVDYHFLTKEEFEREELVCKTNIVGSLYGMRKKDLIDKDNMIIIVDADGLNSLRESKDINFVSIFVQCSADKRFARCIERGDSTIMAMARIDGEQYMFDGVETDYVVDNENRSVAEVVTSVLECVKEAEDCSHQNCTE